MLDVGGNFSVMLFRDILIKKNHDLEPEFDKLFNDILNNQSHEGDLLLVQVNGFYYPGAKYWDNIPNKDPYMIGMGSEGHSDRCHYNFIDLYRSASIYKLTYPEYLNEVAFSEERMEEIKKLEQKESWSIQLEMLIYLKIWEADLFIKKLYQTTLISQGLAYDWHFKIAESNRDNNATGKREDIIRNKIRDILMGKYPLIYSAIKNAYKTQIRNSIAHSRYFHSGRHIHLNNYLKNDPASQLEVISFDNWIDIFHDTMAIYNQLIGFSNRIDSHYSDLIKNPNDTVTVRLNRKDPVEREEFIKLGYREFYNDWHPVH